MEAPNCTTHYLIIRIYSGLTEVIMYPITLSYTYAETISRTQHGRTQVVFKDLADLQIDMTFSEFTKRSNPDPSEIITHLVNNCDEVSLVEAIIKSGMGRKISMELNRQLHREAA
ncbi:hypothetical protein [Xenorhabdus sp. TH1]|uniref:hypothetical protein n=1 Tax=Xenorhabdus sp. TH1 TaxID=3130166 RepID=UPI0030D0EE39